MMNWNNGVFSQKALWASKNIDKFPSLGKT